ncbi:MAG TPA: hypothetical protein PLI89_14265, partial [Chitinophagales bacterium]|nr:hypothetical protein [Chitinophagales bacterium]
APFLFSPMAAWPEICFRLDDGMGGRMLRVTLIGWVAALLLLAGPAFAEDATPPKLDRPAEIMVMMMTGLENLALIVLIFHQLLMMLT